MKQEAELVDVSSMYRRYVVMARNRAERLLGEGPEAQQVAQDAFIKVMEHRERRGPEREWAGFLYRTVTNLALNRLREGIRQQELSALQNGRWGRESKEWQDSQAVLREILALVSYDEGQVAAYYYVDELEPDEIAELLGIEARTVTKRLVCFDERARRLVSVAKARVRHVA